MFKTVFDRDFKYRSAEETDLRRTFARIRREQRTAQRSEQERVNVVVIGPAANSAGAQDHWPFP